MTVPLQQPERLEKEVYESVENEKLRYEKKISFPILLLLNAYVEEGENVKIIAMKHEYENAKKNFETLCKEVQEFEQERKCHCEIIEISVPYNDLIDTHLNTFGELIAHMEEEDELYACMTYGSKPVPIVEMMALNYAYRAKRNTEIGCIAYGQFDHNDKKAKIYDITALFYMDEIVRNVADRNVAEPLTTIKGILNW